jgi:hypothetical protein
VLRESQSATAPQGVRANVPLGHAAPRRRRWPLVVSAVAALGLAALVALVVAPFQQAGWADVIHAVSAKKWLHATDADGAAEFWLSNDLRLWAYKRENLVMFWNQRERAKYEYRAGRDVLTKYPLAEGEVDRILTINGDGEGGATVGPGLFGSEQIVSQRQHEVSEGGKRWIDFDLVLARGAAKYGALRVDAETMLPVALGLSTAQGAKPLQVWQFDYPPEGPKDIFALGVPHGIPIESHLLSEAATRVVDGMTASRALVGDFRLLVAAKPQAFPNYFVWRKKDRWRVDSGRMMTADAVPSPPAGSAEWDAWWQEQLAQTRACPWYVCDGQAVFENADPAGFLNGGPLKWKRSESVGPSDLSSGDRSGQLPYPVRFERLVYPDLTPAPGFTLELDVQPRNAPGCVLVKLSATSTNPRYPAAHEWYWVDPSTGHALVRVEKFSLPAAVPADPAKSRSRQTTVMKEFQKSPQGFWYPGVVEDSLPMSEIGKAPADGAQRTIKTEFHYYFDFDSEIPDAVFDVEEAARK